MMDGTSFCLLLTPNLHLPESKLGPTREREKNSMGALKNTFDSGLTKFTCSGYFWFPHDLRYAVKKKMDESGVEPETFRKLSERATNYATRPCDVLPKFGLFYSPFNN